MEEFNELRQHIESGRYQDALALLDEMEEMSRDDKINKVASLMEVLLIQLIKQAAEKRTTRSWDVTIRNSLRQIVRTNRRRKAGGWYLKPEELLETLEGAYESALDSASLEAFGGKHTTEEIASMTNRSEIIHLALEKIQQQAEDEASV